MEDEKVRLTTLEIREIFKELRKKIKPYNEVIREKGYYLRPYNKVYNRDKRIYYFGGYWFSIKYEKGKMPILKYLGLQKPSPELPDPPKVPKVKITRVGGWYETSKSQLEELEKFIGKRIKKEEEEVKVEKMKL